MCVCRTLSLRSHINNVIWTAYLKHPTKHQLTPPLPHPPYLVHSLISSRVKTATFTATLSSLASPKSPSINSSWSQTLSLRSSPGPPRTITSPPSSTGSQSSNTPPYLSILLYSPLLPVYSDPPPPSISRCSLPASAPWGAELSAALKLSATSYLKHKIPPYLRIQTQSPSL